MPRTIILALSAVGLGLGLSAYAWAGGPGPSSGTPLNPPSAFETPKPPLSDLGPKSYRDQTRRDDLREAEIRAHSLGGRLPPGSNEERDLEWSLSQARRRLDDYQLSQTPFDAEAKRQSLDGALRDIERQSQRAERKANRLP